MFTLYRQRENFLTSLWFKNFQVFLVSLQSHRPSEVIELLHSTPLKILSPPYSFSSTFKCSCSRMKFLVTASFPHSVKKRKALLFFLPSMVSSFSVTLCFFFLATNETYVFLALSFLSISPASFVFSYYFYFTYSLPVCFYWIFCFIESHECFSLCF